MPIQRGYAGTQPTAGPPPQGKLAESVPPLESTGHSVYIYAALVLAALVILLMVS